jgi:hypothetical protein
VLAKAFLSGFEHPVAVMRASNATLFVGDWTTGKVLRISA